MSRRGLLAIIAAIAVASAAIGWIAGQQIKSPAEIAADAEAPTPSLITVPVEQRALSSNVVIRGQVEFNESTDISVSGSIDGVSIITRIPKAKGEDLVEGDVVVEVAGRPLIVLQGELPVFRSLTPTLEGPDVRQLEEALVRLGFDPGTVDDIYNASTEAAVSDLYRQVGYTPDEPTVEELERVEQARRSVRSARDTVRELESASGTNTPESLRLELDRSVNNAQTALDNAVAGKPAAIEQAQQDAADARAARAEAEAEATAAAERLTTAQAGTHPDTGDPVTDAELAEFVQLDVAARTTLEEATAAETEATRIETGIVAEQDQIISDLEVDLRIAEANRTEQLAPPTGAGDGLAQARESLTEEQENLNRLEAEIGVSFPAAELVFLPALPASIQQLSVDVGQIAQGPVMTVTGSGLRITSSVSSTDRSLLSEGVEAVMEDADLGISVPARISFVADQPGGQDVAADRYLVRLEPIGDLPEEALNQNLRVTVPFASTDGEVLAVPLAALSAGADGSSRVEVERADGTVDTVTVVPGLNARALGLVEVTPVDGELAAGDRVVVGRDLDLSAVAGAADDNGEGDDQESESPEEETESTDEAEE